MLVGKRGASLVYKPLEAQRVDALGIDREGVSSPRAHDEGAGTMDPDAKVSGRAVEVTDPEVFAKFADQAPPEGMHLFLVDISEVAVTGVEGEPPELVIDFWTAGGGRSTITRK